MGQSAGAWTLRRRQSARAGTALRALFVGKPRRDLRPRANVRARATRAPVASRRTAPGLRRRRQHGRSGDAPPPGDPPAPPRGRCGVRRAHQHGDARYAAEAWADRSPIYYSRELAFSDVPLELWWSTHDRIVVDQASQSGLLFRAIQRLNPRAPVVQVVGTWQHAAEMRPLGRLPFALARIGLLRVSRVAR